MKKKLIAILIAVGTVIGLAGCYAVPSGFNESLYKI